MTNYNFKPLKAATDRLEEKLSARTVNSLSDAAKLARCSFPSLAADELDDIAQIQFCDRLLRLKFGSMPAFTNEELAHLLECPTGGYLAGIMNRIRFPSPTLWLIMHRNMRTLEARFGYDYPEQLIPTKVLPLLSEG